MFVDTYYVVACLT